MSTNDTNNISEAADSNGSVEMFGTLEELVNDSFVFGLGMNARQRVGMALNQFYKASLEPLREYNQRMIEIEQHYKDSLAPFENNLRAAKDLCELKDQELRRARETAAPELNAQYEAEVERAWNEYKTKTAPHSYLRELTKELAEGLFEKILKWDTVGFEPDSLKEMGIGMDAIHHRISGKVETLSPKECTIYAACDLAHKLCSESMKLHESKREEAIKPSQLAHSQAVKAATAEFEAEYKEAYEQSRATESKLNAARSQFYKQKLESRAQARLDCEQKIVLLQDELAEALRSEFTALNNTPIR